MKKKPYVKPTVEVENFIITDYVATCNYMVRDDPEWEELKMAADIAGISVEEAAEFGLVDCKNTPTAFVGLNALNS